MKTMMREAEYLKIKELLKFCNKNASVITITGRSRATIGRIKQSKDYEDYKRILCREHQEEKPEQIRMDCIETHTKTNNIADLVSAIADKLCELAAMLNA